MGYCWRSRQHCAHRVARQQRLSARHWQCRLLRHASHHRWWQHRRCKHREHHQPWSWLISRPSHRPNRLAWLRPWRQHRHQRQSQLRPALHRQQHLHRVAAHQQSGHWRCPARRCRVQRLHRLRLLRIPPPQGRRRRHGAPAGVRRGHALEGRQLDEIDGIPSDRFHYLQLCDAPHLDAPTVDDLRRTARSERLYPGEGDSPIREIVAKLPGLPLALEVTHAARIQELGYERFAKACLDRTRAWLGDA